MLNHYADVSVFSPVKSLVKCVKERLGSQGYKTAFKHLKDLKFEAAHAEEQQNLSGL